MQQSRARSAYCSFDSQLRFGSRSFVPHYTVVPRRTDPAGRVDDPDSTEQRIKGTASEVNRSIQSRFVITQLRSRGRVALRLGAPRDLECYRHRHNHHFDALTADQ